MKRISIASLFVWAAIAATPANAATPYSCMCDGAKKRFLGSTYYCGRRTPKCTTAEYVKFRKRACLANKCVAIK